MKRTPIVFDKDITGVYIIRCIPTDMIYVGSSVNIRTRWSEHINLLNRKDHENYYLQDAWTTWGSQSFDFSVLDMCPIDELQECEQRYLDFYKSYERNVGYNIAKLAFLPPMTKESRKRQSKSLKRNTEFIENCRDFMIKLHQDPVQHQKLIDSIKSSQKVKDNLKKLNESEEHKKQVQELLKQVHTDPRIQEHVKNMANYNKLDLNWRKLHGVKNVAQFDSQGNFIRIFRSLGEVQDALTTDILRIDRSAISDCCKGKRKLYKNYIWKFIEDEDYELFLERNNQGGD